MDDTLSSSCCAPFAGRPGPVRALSSAARAASDSTVLFRASSICKADLRSYHYRSKGPAAFPHLPCTRYDGAVRVCV